MDAASLSRPPLILASASPRRRELLAALALPFAVGGADVDETPPARTTPAAVAAAIARRKLDAAVAKAQAGAIVLVADTVVAFDGCALGKPRDAAEAARMLRLLSGREHQVTTGVSLVHPNGNTETLSATTQVFFRTLTEDEIQQYVAGGEPMDKAGAYAIQGGASRWTDRIVGEYSNVVGLPLSLVTEMLRKSGLLS